MTIADFNPALLIIIGAGAFIFGISDKKATPQGRKSASLYGIFYTLAVLLLNTVNSFSQSAGEHLLASLILFVCAYPLWKYLLRSEKGIPFMPFLCIIYGLYFALPAFSTADAYYRFRGVPAGVYVTTLSLVLCGLVAMLTTFYGLPRNLWKGILPQKFAVGWAGEKADGKAQRAALVFALIGFASRLINGGDVPVIFGAASGFIDQLSAIAIAILFLLQLQGKLSKPYIFLLWGMFVPLQLLIDIGTGLLYSSFKDSFLLAMIFLLVKKRLPWTAIAAATTVFLALLMVKGDYRKLTWYSNAAPDPSSSSLVGPLANGQIYVNLLSAKFSSWNGQQVQHDMEDIVARLDNRSMFAYVVDKTPTTVAYWNGETYALLVSRLLPRILWADKPMETLGIDFGHRYNITDANDDHTSMNLPLIVEMYANFGSVGVIIGMAVLGLIYHALRYLLESDQSDQWAIVTSLIIYTSLLQIDSNFSLVFGNVIYSLALFYILGRLIFGGVPLPQRMVTNRGLKKSA